MKMLPDSTADRQELLKHEHERAMQLVQQEKAVAANISAAAEEKMRKAEMEYKVLMEKEEQLKRMVSEAEEQVMHL